MNALILLLTITTSTLVLRSGDRIKVDGPIAEENGVLTFRVNGLLYSMPASEIASFQEVEAQAEETAPRRLKLSAEERERRLRELEQNHTGTPAPPTQTVPPAPPPPTPAQEASTKREEWEWRQEARAHEEAVRRAKEDVALIEDRIDQLQSEIRTFVSLGIKPRQFTYQSSQLLQAMDQLPYLRLEVERAQRTLEKFREDARRQGVLPGWLR